MTPSLQQEATYPESTFVRFSSVGNPTVFRRGLVKPKFGVQLIPQDVARELSPLCPHSLEVRYPPREPFPGIRGGTGEQLPANPHPWNRNPPATCLSCSEELVKDEPFRPGSDQFPDGSWGE